MMHLKNIMNQLYAQDIVGVRFIAINDNYDSENINSSEILMMHLKNIMNQLYAQDIVILQKVKAMCTEIKLKI